MKNVDRACPQCGSQMFRNGRCSNCGYLEGENIVENEGINQTGPGNPDVSESIVACPQCGSLMFQNRRCYKCGFAFENNDSNAQMIEPQNNQPVSQNNQPVYPPNLVPCPDCNHLVSLYATSCTNCGRPLKPMKELSDTDENEPIQTQPENSGGGCGTFVAVVLGILVAVWILSKILRIEITGTIIPIK